MSTGEAFAYHDGDVALSGWLVRPAGAVRGGIVIYPTIMNRNAAMDRRAGMLAELGFVVLVADFYGAPVNDFAHSRELAGALRTDVDGYRRRLLAAIDALAPVARPVAAVGYCMGGQAALEVARAGADLALVASFHGLLDTGRPADAPITPRVLVCHGDADPMAPRSQVLAFWQEMDQIGAQWHFHAYSGVRHGFTDPASDARGLPAIGYDASADRQSWAALLNLLDEVVPR